MLQAEPHLPLIVGRYAVYQEVAVGGMASVHFGRLLGPSGFQRTVAIKRLHPQFARDPEFVSQFMDEARLTAHIQHPNVVQTLDIVTTDTELWIVMEYVEGETLARLIKMARSRSESLPIGFAVTAVADALHGLHGAHQAKGNTGRVLGVVHRDVSPQNILVGVDGITRVLDFGIAKAVNSTHATRQGQLKGKLSYMSPEQASGHPIDARTDVFAAGIVLWESLTGNRLFNSDDQIGILNQVLNKTVEAPSKFRPEISPDLDRVVLKSLEREPDERYQAASEFASALESLRLNAVPRDVGNKVRELCGPVLEERTSVVSAIALHSAGSSPNFEIPTLPGDGLSRLSIPSDGSSTVEITRGGWTQRTVLGKRRRMGALLLVVVAMAAGGAAVGVALSESREQAIAKALPSSPPAVPTELGELEPVPSASALEPSQVAHPADTETEPDAATKVTPVPMDSASKPIRQRQRQRSTPAHKPKPKPPPQPDCSSPTYVDSDGIVRFKRECL